MNNQSLDWLTEKIQTTGYIAESGLVSSLHLMNALQKPLLIEGEAGVGKTGVAECLAGVYDSQLVRLQCYEGLDASQALYDWNYQKQLLKIQLAATASAPSGDAITGAGPDISDIYGEDYLLERPLLKSIASDTPVVLLIDEVDRADEEFEALLLEILSDYQISIPELGVFKAQSRPRVILTSNGVRELSDALRRRCLYHYMDYPDHEKEKKIVESHLPDIHQDLVIQIVDFVQQLREDSLRKTPGVAETLDWAAALLALDVRSVEDAIENSIATIASTLPALLKTRADQEKFRNPDEISRLLGSSRQGPEKSDA